MNRFLRKALALLLLTSFPASAQNMMLLGVGAKVISGGSPLLLNSLAGTPWAAYSTEQLSSSATKAIQVSNDGGTTLQDIGFSAGDFNAATLSGFCTGHTCGVTKLYDQTGAGHDCVFDHTLVTLPVIWDNGSNVPYAWNGHAAIHYAGSSLAFCATTLASNLTGQRYYNQVLKLDSYPSASPVIMGSDNNGSGLTETIQGSGTQATSEVILGNLGVTAIGNSTANIVSTSTGNVLEAQYDSANGNFFFKIDAATQGSGTTLSNPASGSHVSIGGGEFSAGVAGLMADAIIFDGTGPVSGDMTKIEITEKAYRGTP